MLRKIYLSFHITSYIFLILIRIMVLIVGCDVAGGTLQLKNYNPLFVKLHSVPQLRYQDIEKIDNFFSVVKTKISKPINYFTAILDGSYKNNFQKKFIEIGRNYDISHINIVGVHQALFCKAIHDISVPINYSDVLWIFSLWKSQVCCTVWKADKKIRWKFVEYKKGQKGLGNHSGVTAISTLKSKIENYNKPTFVVIYNKNLKAISTNKKFNFNENILDAEEPAIINLFHQPINVYFQRNLVWCDLAFLHATKISTSLTNFKNEDDIIFEKNILVKVGKKVIFNIPKWQILPFTETLNLKASENDTIEIYEENAFLYDIRLNQQKPLNVTATVDTNGIYDIIVNSGNIPTNIKTQKIEKTSTFDHFYDKLQTKNMPTSYNFIIPLKISEYDKKLNAIGIDLGTTECCAAVIRKNGPDFVVLDQTTGLRTMPSYVAYDEKERKCGKIVIDRMWYKSEYTAYDSKRIIGKTYDRLATDPLWPFSISNLDNHVLIEIKTFDGVSLKRPEEISAALLKHIKSMLEQYQGTILTEAVITIPSEFTETQKNATKIAAEMAGWETVHFIPEPVAAAFAYFTDIDIPNESNILICDCGGGTVDICVAKINNHELECLSFDGDSYLGGRDFDKILYNHFNAILKNKYGIDVKESNRKYILNQKCQNIKHNLSIASEDWLGIDNFGGDSNEIILIKREEFEELSARLMLRLKNVIYNAISKTSLECKQIDYIFQVGGGCRMPMIKEMLKEIFHQAKHECNLYPDWVVAHGAALYAYFLKTKA